MKDCVSDTLNEIWDELDRQTIELYGEFTSRIQDLRGRMVTDEFLPNHVRTFARRTIRLERQARRLERDLIRFMGARNKSTE